MLIDGQVHGGIVHAIGQALYEQVVYDEEGQLVTGTFVDYALPTAAELPSFETDRTETPSPVNSLGVKGVGEAGTIAATPAVAAAVLDALSAARRRRSSTCRSRRCACGRRSRPRAAATAAGRARASRGARSPSTGRARRAAGPAGPDEGGAA